jgi:superfamily II DNA or RNA helicase
MNLAYISCNGFVIKKSDVTVAEVKMLREDLTIVPVVLEAFKSYDGSQKSYKIYMESPSYYFLPRYYGCEKFSRFVIKNKLRVLCLMGANITFGIALRSHQFVAYDAVLNCLRKVNGGILSLPCGYGKTAIAIKLAVELHGKTIVIVNKECLMDQWIDSIYKFCGNGVRIGIIQRDKFDIVDKDFVIAMIHTLALHNYEDNTFESFGMAIIDECHHVGSEMFSKILFKLSCPYMLGLSATPVRKDGLSRVFEYFIGRVCHSEKRSGGQALNVLVKQVNCYSNSREYNNVLMNGKNIKDTGQMITNLTISARRNELISGIIQKLMTGDRRRKILVLSARREHLTTLYKMLPDTFTFGYYLGNNGSNKSKHKLMLAKSATCDVILGTYHIASEGLDIPDLNTLILATPSTDIEQSVGRILRKYHEIHPVIIDLVDHFGNFKKHFAIRKKLYNAEEYVIEKYDMYIDDSIECDIDHIRSDSSLIDNNSDMEDSIISDVTESECHI